MSKPRRMQNKVTIHLARKAGTLSPYWSAVVRRGAKGPILFENSAADRAVALAGAEIWCKRLGYQTQIKES